MGQQTLKEKIVSYIGHIGWLMFCWSYYGGEKQYLADFEEHCLRMLDTAPIAETKVDDEERLWVRLDNFLPEKAGKIRLVYEK